MSSKANKVEPNASAQPGEVLPPDLYRAVLNFANEPIALISLQGIYLEQNNAHAALLGYSDRELINQTPALHLGAEVFAAVARKLAETGEYRGRVKSTTKTGEIKHIELSAFTIRDEAGAPLCYVGIKRDITGRKRTEGRLALQYEVTKILSESLEISESTHKILRAACETLDWEVGVLWQVDPAEPVLHCLEICHTNGRSTPEFDQLSKSLAFKKGVGLPGRIWETGLPCWIDDVVSDSNFPRAPVARREGLRGAFGFPILLGDEVWGVLEFFSPEIREPDGELMKLAVAVGGQVGQFTKRKRAEAERIDLLDRERSARSDAERANRLKDEFLATLSHELRTPLNAVIGWSRMLSSGRLDRESSKHALEVIERNAWAQKQIIEDILDVSRVITGKLQLNLGPVDLVVVIDAALDAVRPAMEAKEIKIETIIDTGLRMISGDPDRLQQVVWNVLSNAAKFTPNGGSVQISVNQTETHVVIQVKDNGPGIQSEFLPHVFERFRQADGSITRTHGGLGLGLAIVRHLVELHGGTISVENGAEGSGAIFTIRLPLPSGELSGIALINADSAFKEGRSTVLSLEGLRLLIVDDETDTLDLISVELAQHGATVTAVSNADEALAALQRERFDLLISDIAMPKVDGYELIRQIRRDEQGKDSHLPAVALTAYARVQDRMQAIMAGFSTHVAKPVEANELVTVVASLTGRITGEKGNG